MPLITNSYQNNTAYVIWIHILNAGVHWYLLNKIKFIVYSLERNSKYFNSNVKTFSETRVHFYIIIYWAGFIKSRVGGVL